MSKSRSITIVGLGLMGGLLGSLIGLNIFLPRIESNLTSNLKDSFLADKVSPEPDMWQKISSGASLSSVGIQVFQNNKIIRQGSGLVVSADGLILTTADVAVPDSIYQVFYGGDILKGQFVTGDRRSNLAFLKVDKNDLTVSDLELAADYKNGTEVLIFGKTFDLSQLVEVSQKGLVSYVTEKNILIDTNYSNVLNGAKIINSRGRVIGIAYLRDRKIYMVRASTVDEFIKNNLAK